jgi:hypothetical protein
MAYQGEGITSPQRQRITIKAINESAASTGAKAVVEHHNGGGNDGINLKAKVKGKDGTGASPAPESLPTPVLESKDPIARASIAKLTEAIIAKCEHESKPHQKLKNLLKWAFDAVPDRVLSEWLREYCTTAEMVDAIELILDDVKDIPEFLQGHVEALEPLKPWTEITSAPQQRITIKTINGSSANTGCEPTSKHRNGDGNDGINLKTKIKGGGNLGELINKVSPAARAAIESQLHPAGNGGLVQKANASIVAPVEDESSKPTSNPRLIDPLKLGGKEIAGFFQGPLLVDALLLQLKECSETKNPGEIDACVSYLKPIVKWYEKYAAK